MISPAKLPSTFQQSISLPTEYCSPARLLEYFSPRRLIHSPSSFPDGVIFSYRYSYNYRPQRKQIFFSSTSAQELPPGTRQGFIFLRQKDTFINIIFSYITARIYASYFTNLIYVENIIAWSISCIAYDWPLPFRKNPVKFSSRFQAFSGSVRSTLRSPCFLSSWRISRPRPVQLSRP